MHHGYLSSHLLRVVFWTNSNTHNYWQVISLFPIATIHCKKKQHIGYNLATEWLPWLRTDCIKRSKGQLPSSSTTTIHWQHPWGNHLLSLQAWKLLTATLKCICNCNLTESCQCIVVLRWTEQLLLGLPYPISLQYQSKHSHNHCLFSLSATRVTRVVKRISWSVSSSNQQRWILMSSSGCLACVSNSVIACRAAFTTKLEGFFRRLLQRTWRLLSKVLWSLSCSGDSAK